MRLSENKIKEAILDDNLEVRLRAIRYFAESHSADASIMPLVIQAVQAFGRQDAYRLMGAARELPQSVETIAWIIDELNNPQSKQYEDYAYNLSMVLMAADPALLLPEESAILESQHFQPDLCVPFSERLQMLSCDEAMCWQRLEDFCEENKDKEYINEVNLAYAERIVEALARYGDDCKEKAHALLGQKVDDYRHNPMSWMEPLAVQWAGLVCLDSIVPSLISKLIEDGGDLLNEQCAEALTRIGTSAVLEAVAEAYPNAPHHFRLYATGPLEHIHSDLAVEKCLHLLRQEKEQSIRISLAQALLTQFSQEGIDEARNLLVGRELDFESRGLRNYLLETCTVMGERFPEYDAWRTAEQVEKAQHRKRVKEAEGDPAEMMLYAFEKLSGRATADIPQAKPSVPQASVQNRSTIANKQRIGRNDPCPCRSGKKFKNCCLRKNGGDIW